MWTDQPRPCRNPPMVAMTDSWVVFTTGAGALAGMILAMTAVASRRLGPHRGWLALAIAGLTLRIGKSSLNAVLDLEPWMRNVGLAGLLVAGPATWLFAAARPVDRRGLVHLAPAVVFTLLAAWIPNEPRQPLSLLVYGLVVAHYAGYLGVAGRTDRTRSTLLLVLPQAVLAVLFVAVAFGFPGLYLPTMLAGLLALVGFSGPVVATMVSRVPVEQPRYAYSNWHEDDYAALATRFDRLLDDPALFTRPDLTLAAVARRLGVSAKRVSEAINQRNGDSFRQALNRRRVDHALPLLASGRGTITEIALACGFNSPESFARAFRRIREISPSDYRQQNGDP